MDRPTLRSSVSAKSSFLVVLLLALPAVAAAKKVVVEKLGGRGTRYVQVTVEEVVKRENAVASPTAFRNTAKRKKVSLRKDAGWAKVSKQMGVDAIVSGDFKKAGRKAWKLTLSVREGRSGSAMETVTVTLATARPSAAEKEKIAVALLPVLARTAAVASPADEPAVEVTPPPAPAPAGKPPTQVAQQESEDTEAAPLRAELPSQISEKTDTSVSAVAGEELVTARRYRYAGADVAVGVGFLKRNLDFDSSPALAPANQPNGYKGGTPVAGLAVFGEIYPLSFGDRGGWLSGFGIGFGLDRVFTLKSKLGTTEYDTTQTDYSIGLRYRYNFGNSPKLPSVKLLFGYNHLDFKIDHGAADIDLPDVSYSYLDAGLAFRVPLTVPWLALFAEGRYLIVLSSGQISDQMFYGDGSTKGLDIGGGIEARIAEAWSVRGGVRYRRISFDFDGTGTKSNNRDGNPSSQDVTGATDMYLTGYVLVGYVF
jgi:hypothetical protein